MAKDQRASDPLRQPREGRRGTGPRPPSSALPGEVLPAGALPDYIRPGLRLLIVGSNPGIASSRAGHYYAAPSNAFWRLLADSGITPERWRPEQDAELLSLGIGITDIVKRPTPGTADLKAADFAAGRERLARILEMYHPPAVAYTAKTVYGQFVGIRDTSSFDYGWQDASAATSPDADQMRDEMLAARHFVLPSPSGRSGIPYSEKLRWYHELAAALGLRPR